MRWLSIGGWVAGTCKFLFSGSVGRLISAISSAWRNVGPTQPWLFRCIYVTLYHAIYQTLISRVLCFLHVLRNHQSLLDTWCSTQISGIVNTSFHP